MALVSVSLNWGLSFNMVIFLGSRDLLLLRHILLNKLGVIDLKVFHLGKLLLVSLNEGLQSVNVNCRSLVK